jgi:hypothetical protein
MEESIYLREDEKTVSEWDERSKWNYASAIHAGADAKSEHASILNSSSD